MLLGVPWSKRMSISGRETVYRNNWSCKAACDKFKDCVHLFLRYVELFHYFLNGHTSLKIHKHSGDRHPGIFENPHTAHLSGDAFGGGAL